MFTHSFFRNELCAYYINEPYLHEPLAELYNKGNFLAESIQAIDKVMELTGDAELAMAVQCILEAGGQVHLP